MGAFDLTIGALLLGFSFNIYPYGLVCHRYLAYASLEFNDPIWLRALVAVLFAIDTSQTILEFYGVWYFAVENYANPTALTGLFWVSTVTGITTALSSFIVQAFLIHRLWRFTGQFWFCSFLNLAALGACLCGVIACIQAALLVDLAKFAAIVPLATACLGMEAGVDIIITVFLSRTLWLSKTGRTRTNTIIHRCSGAAIQSGLFSSVFAIANLVVFVLWTDTYLYTIFSWPLGRIYSYSLLYTLVIRKELLRIAYGTSDAEGVRVSGQASCLSGVDSIIFPDCDQAKSSLD
ncbi:hypothetical protein DL96DRAFT_1023574 [Flagelloscypha sp. PMI_526]|nr:hypothetical protein DL96DRAFT_1023574 [Flagelloscypha sp. PMI_526]